VAAAKVALGPSIKVRASAETYLEQTHIWPRESASGARGQSVGDETLLCLLLLLGLAAVLSLELRLPARWLALRLTVVGALSERPLVRR